MGRSNLVQQVIAYSVQQVANINAFGVLFFNCFPSESEVNNLDREKCFHVERRQLIVVCAGSGSVCGVKRKM